MKGKRSLISRWLRYYIRRSLGRRIAAIFIGIFVVITLAGHIWLATYLQPLQAKDGDGKAYTQLAVNLLEHETFSLDEAPPFQPTYIRLPGYPIFLAGVYYFSGSGNNLAVAAVQGAIDTATCLLAAMIAWDWEPDTRRKRKAAWLAFVLMAVCPFTAVYGSMILTESLATFLLAATVLSATFAVRVEGRRTSVIWWAIAGLMAGLAVFVRPDSGLFALGVGVWLIVKLLFSSEGSVARRLLPAVLFGGIFTIAFLLPLVPWTIRNERVFGIFQPLAPVHAEGPGEFVPFGYLRWVRTWIDDQRYIAPVLWNLEDYPIKVEQIPPYAFDSDDEKQKVAALLDQYNHSAPPDSADSTDDESPDDATSEDDKADESDDSAGEPDEDHDQSNEPQDLKITPEVNASFGAIADERIERHRFGYYVELPAERAVGMWFDTHSMYYPFAGELFPLKDLDTETGQEIWLPLFAALVWAYTLLSLVGAFLLLRSGKARFWVILAALLVIPRVVFFSTLENPEPRYFVELFLFTAVLGGIALARVGIRRSEGKLSLEYDYSR